MNIKTLILAPQLMEKQAFTRALQTGGKAIADRASKNDFVGGLLSPLAKLFGSGQRAVGYGQQGLAAARNPNVAASQLRRSKPFLQGQKNIDAGRKMNDKFRLTNTLFNSSKPWQYRVGRGVGAVGIGAPIAMAPFSLAQYAGAANVDPSILKEYAKGEAEDRFNTRMQQFAQMPFLQRIQTAWNPESFTNQIAESSPEAMDLNYAMQNDQMNNPGILKYLSSFNPFLLNSQPDTVLRQKVRGEIGNYLGNNSVKTAGLLQRFIQPAWQAGRVANSAKALRATGEVNKARGVSSSATRQLNNILKTRKGQQAPRAWEDFLTRGTFQVAKNPGAAALGAGGVAFTGLGIPMSYGAGKESIYSQAAQDARGLADLQFMQTFNTPGFMAGATRFGAAMMPGLAQNYASNSLRNILYQGQ